MFGDVAVVIPWQPGCVYRELNLQWISKAWDALGLYVVEGALDEGQPWCKADAVRAGLHFTDAEVVVIVDADVWSEHWDVAIEKVVSGEFPYAMPHSDIRRLDPAATSRILKGDDSGFDGRLVQPAYPAVLGGGAVVIRRDVYERCPLDPRFVGWGQEDEAWGIALRKLIGPGGVARNAPLWHLWHPPQERMNRRTGSNEGRLMRDRYIAAARRPGALEALIADVVFQP